MQLSNTMYEVAGCYTDTITVNLAILATLICMYLILKALWKRSQA